MASLDVIRTLTVRAKQEGFPQTEGAVRSLGETYESSARRQTSMETKLQSLERQFVSNTKQVQTFNRVMEDLNRVQAQMPQQQDRINAVLDAAASKLGLIQSATGNVTAQFSRMNSQLGIVVNGIGTVSSSVAGLGTNLGSIQTGTGAVTARLASFNNQLSVIKEGVVTTTVSLGQMGNQFNTLKSTQVTTSLQNAGAQIGNVGNQTKLARYELINLSRQIQDVGVGLASGQSPFTVLIQQGTQIADVFASSSATIKGAFTQIGSIIATVLAPLNLLIGGLTALGVGALIAAQQFASAQRQIQQSLFGIGRASGETLESINKIGEAAATTFGLSISEATKFATTLAATGKLGGEQLKTLVDLGKEFSRVFGTDVEDAAKQLANTFSGDLAQGALDLNKRLAIFDAATVQNIRNLQAQGNELQANAIIIKGLGEAMDAASRQIQQSGTFWTALGNIISNLVTRLGQFGNVIFNLAPKGLETQIAEVTAEVAALENQVKQAGSGGFFEAMGNALNEGVGSPDTTAALEAARKKLADLTEQMRQYQKSVMDAKAVQDSFNQSALIRQALPEIAQRETIQNQLTGLQKIRDEAQATGGSMSEVLTRAKMSWDQLNTAIEQSENALKTFRTSFEQATASAELALKATTALTPAQKASQAASEAKLQAEIQGRSATQAATLAELAYKTSLSASTVALQEAADARRLASKQATESAQLEVDLIGKTNEQQTLARLNLQSRQQLEQAALQTHTQVNQKELEALEKQNAQTAALLEKRRKLDELAQQLGDFLNTLVSGLVAGEKATVALGKAMDQLGQSIARAATQKIGESIIGGVAGSAAGGAAGSGLSGLLGGVLGAGGLGLSGAALGAATGGASLAVGVGLSLIGGLLQKNSQAEQEHAQALAQSQQAAIEASKSLSNLTDQMRKLNDVAGPVTSSIKSAQEQFKAVQQQGQATQQAAFQFAAQGGNLAIAAKAFQDAADQVDSARKELEKYNQRIIENAEAALKAGPALGETSQAVADLNKQADDLKEAMQAAGSSSEDAARSVRDDLAVALSNLATKTSEDLSRSINEATGRGFINQFTDLFKRLADLQSLPQLDPALVEKFFITSAQAIVDSAHLTGQAFDDLLAQFPQLINVVHAAARSIEEVTSAAQALQDRLFAATNDPTTLAGALAAFDRNAEQQILQEREAGGENLLLLEQTLAAERLRVIQNFNDDAIAAEKKAAEDRLKEINAVASDIVKYVNSLFSGPESPLSPAARLQAAQDAYNAVLAVAQTGDITAQQQITQFAEDLRKAALDFYGSSTGYQSIVTQIKNQLLALPAPTGATDPVVNALNNVLTGVNNTTTAVNSNTGAVNSQTSTQSTENAAQLSQQQSIVSLNTTANSLATTANSLITSSNNLITSTNNLVTSTNSILSAIQALNTTANSTLDAIKNQTAVLISSENHLNIIESNTSNASARLNSIDPHTAHMFAPSGSINFNLAGGGFVGDAGVAKLFRRAYGGPIGTDTVPGWLTPGEFVVRQPVAEANASSLSQLNRTGHWPANDNDALLARIASLLERIEANTMATAGGTVNLAREQRFAARKAS